jgi:alpha-tubulin suppressor-like RCC1 family protein
VTPTKLTFGGIYRPIDIFSGDSMFGVILSSGQVVVWGRNSYGTLGLASSTAYTASPIYLNPGPIYNDINVLQVTVSRDSFNYGTRLLMLGRNSTSGDQAYFATGFNYGNVYLLDSSLQNAQLNTPQKITFANTPLVGQSIISASAEGAVSAYVTGEGKLWFFLAINAVEELPYPTLGDINYVSRDRIVKVTTSDANYCTGHMIDAAGYWWFFGDMIAPGFFGFTTVNSNWPQFGTLYQVPTPSSVRVVDIASGNQHAIALTSNRDLLCLGTMPGGAFSNAFPSYCFFNAANNVTAIASSTQAALVALGNGSIYVWGTDRGSNVFNRPTRVGTLISVLPSPQ